MNFFAIVYESGWKIAHTDLPDDDPIRNVLEAYHIPLQDHPYRYVFKRLNGSDNLPERFLCLLTYPFNAGQDVHGRNITYQSVGVVLDRKELSLGYQKGDNHPPTPFEILKTLKEIYVDNNQQAIRFQDQIEQLNDFIINFKRLDQKAPRLIRTNGLPQLWLLCNKKQLLQERAVSIELGGDTDQAFEYLESLFKLFTAEIASELSFYTGYIPSHILAGFWFIHTGLIEKNRCQNLFYSLQQFHPPIPDANLPRETWQDLYGFKYLTPAENNRLSIIFPDFHNRLRYVKRIYEWFASETIAFNQNLNRGLELVLSHESGIPFEICETLCSKYFHRFFIPNLIEFLGDIVYSDNMNHILHFLNREQNRLNEKSQTLFPFLALMKGLRNLEEDNPGILQPINTNALLDQIRNGPNL